ncbi:hypothetical protein [Actinomyces howellii]|uniref:Uncharacterized protein n=1 Tax=Actinomyces howellii TaxID=52771 RepID=A0A3S4R9F8_9ACTO|nr:hypothetical protein [Actinomyces howellii]VEG25850.1 Uncharacterised protein [Actinomyces howellii]
MSGPEPARAPEVRPVEDRRRPAYGWGRLLVAVFAVFGVVVLVPAAVALVRDPGRAPVIGSLNVAAGLLFILLAVCVAHNGRRMRLVGWMSLTALLTGALLVGLLTWTGTAPLLAGSVWAHGGRRLAFLPLALPVVAGVWMWMSDPRRIVVTAERFTDLSESLSESISAARREH